MPKVKDVNHFNKKKELRFQDILKLILERQGGRVFNLHFVSRMKTRPLCLFFLLEFGLFELDIGDMMRSLFQITPMKLAAFQARGGAYIPHHRDFSVLLWPVPEHPRYPLMF
jgi:hypothetical protein